MKRVIKSFFTVMFTAVLLIIDVIPVGAQELDEQQGVYKIDSHGGEYHISGDYEYEIKTAGGVNYAYIHEYKGSETTVNIPSSIDGYIVCGIETMIFFNNRVVKKVNLPNTISSIAAGAFATAYELEKISIDKNAISGFHVVDNVLYSGNQIIAYPPAREGSVYTILDGTTAIQAEAFYGCSKLDKIVVPESVITVCYSSFARSVKPIDIVLKKDSFTASYIDGACWEMAQGTRFIVKNSELRERVALDLKDTNSYKDSSDKMIIEVENTPATALTFVDGSTVNNITISYDTSARYPLSTLYMQTPSDTTDNVTWNIINGAGICNLSGEGNNILSTKSGGNVVLEGKDESGHAIILNVTIVNPVNYFELEFMGASKIIEGEDTRLFADIVPNTSYAYINGVTWESSDSNVATVEVGSAHSCTVTGISAGKATITARINDNGVLVEKTVDILVMGNIMNCTIDPIPTQTYLGNQVRPVPVVRYHNRILEEGADYKVSYGENVLPGSRMGIVWIRGMNTTFIDSDPMLVGYFDIVDGTEKDNILPVCNGDDSENKNKQPTPNEIGIIGVKNSYTKAYGSRSFILKAKGPAAITYISSDKKVVTVGRTSGKVTIKGVGKATITVKSGNLKKKITIRVIPQKLSCVKVSALGKKTIKVSWKKDKMATGYQVQYAVDSKFTKEKKTITIKKNKTTSYKINKLKGNKKYYIRVCSFRTVKGKKYFGEWRNLKSVKIK